MGDERGWAWVLPVVRPALELFGIATLVLAFAGWFPGFIVAVAVMEYREEAPRAAAASTELLAGEREFAFMVGGFGVALAVVAALVGYRLVRRAGVRSRIASPWTVAVCAVACAAVIVTVFLLLLSASDRAAGYAVGAMQLLIVSLGIVGVTEIHVALRRTSRESDAAEP